MGFILKIKTPERVLKAQKKKKIKLNVYNI